MDYDYDDDEEAIIWVCQGESRHKHPQNQWKSMLSINLARHFVNTFGRLNLMHQLKWNIKNRSHNTIEPTGKKPWKSSKSANFDIATITIQSLVEENFFSWFIFSIFGLLSTFLLLAEKYRVDRQSLSIPWRHRHKKSKAERSEEISSVSEDLSWPIVKPIRQHQQQKRTRRFVFAQESIRDLGNEVTLSLSGCVWVSWCDWLTLKLIKHFSSVITGETREVINESVDNIAFVALETRNQSA